MLAAWSCMHFKLLQNQVCLSDILICEYSQPVLGLQNGMRRIYCQGFLDKCYPHCLAMQVWLIGMTPLLASTQIWDIAMMLVSWWGRLSITYHFSGLFGIWTIITWNLVDHWQFCISIRAPDFSHSLLIQECLYKAANSGIMLGKQPIES